MEFTDTELFARVKLLRSKDSSDLQLENMLEILVALDVSNPLTSTFRRLVHPLNKLLILVHAGVFQLLRSSSVRLLQLLKALPMLVTAEVSKPLTSRLVRLLQL